jgi:adenylate cyclase
MTPDARRDRHRKMLSSAISYLMLGVCLTAGAALFYSPARDVLLKTEHWTADWRTALLSDRIDHLRDDIVVVVFNSETLAGRPSTLTVPRDLQGKVIRAIDSAGPRAIGLDFYFVHPTQPDVDRAFLEVLRTTKAPLVVGAANEGADQFKDFQLTYQRSFTADSGRDVAYINVRHDRDDVVRYTSAPISDTAYPESLAVRLAQVSGMKSGGKLFSFPPRRIAWLWGEHQNQQPFEKLSAQSLLNDSLDNPPTQLRTKLAGKIVLIGVGLPYIDRHRTPLSILTGDTMIGAMIHAQVLAQLLDGRELYDLSVTGDRVVLAIVAMLGMLLGWYFWQRRVNFLSLGAATVVLVAIDAVSFYFLRTVLPLTLALFTWFIAVTAGHHLRVLSRPMRSCPITDAS